LIIIHYITIIVTANRQYISNNYLLIQRLTYSDLFHWGGDAEGDAVLHSYHEGNASPTRSISVHIKKRLSVSSAYLLEHRLNAS